MAPPPEDDPTEDDPFEDDGGGVDVDVEMVTVPLKSTREITESRFGYSESVKTK